MLHRPFTIIAFALLLLLLPVAFFNGTLIPLDPEEYLTHTAKDAPGYFSRDPTGAVVELAYAGFSRAEILTGHIPLWSPYQSFGHPFVADIPSSALFAPLNQLRLLLPPSYWDLIFLLNLILGCYFVYLLARIYGLNRRSALIAGLTYASLGATQIHVQVSSICLVTTWIPLFLFGIELELRRIHNKFSWLSIIVGLYGIITGGHPTITLIAMLFCVLYLLFRLLQLRPSGKVLLRLGALAAVALLMSAVQWVPFVQYVRYRGNTFSDYSGLRFDVRHAPAFLLPYVYGELNTTSTPTQPPVELTNYWSLGWVPSGLLMFFVAGFRGAMRSKRNLRSGPIALLGAALFLTLWAFGIPPFNFASKLPFVNRIRGHYAPVSLAFVPCILTGFGYRYISSKRCNFRRSALSCLAILLLAGVAAVASLAFGGLSPERGIRFVLKRTAFDVFWAVAVMAAFGHLRRSPALRLHYNDRLFWLSAVLVLLSAICFFPWASQVAIERARLGTLAAFMILGIAAIWPVRKPAHMMAALSAAAILTCGVWILTAPQHLPRRHDLFASTAYVDFLKRQKPEFRSYGMDGFLFPNFSAARQISSLNIITGMLPVQIEHFIKSYLDGYQGPEQLMGLTQARNSASDQSPGEQVKKNKRFWDYIGVRYFVSYQADFAEQKVRVNTAAVIPAANAAQPEPGSTPQLLMEPVQTILRCPPDEVTSVCFFLGTYGKVNPGRLKVKAFDAGGNPVGVSEIDSASVRDLACTRFDFPRNVCAAGEKRILQISHEKYAPDSGIAIFRGLDVADIESEILTVRQKSFRRVFEDPISHGEVWEDQAAKPRVYLAPESTAVTDWQTAQRMFASQDELRRKAFVEGTKTPCASNAAYPHGPETARLNGFELSADRVHLRMQVFTPGTLVLVDTYMPGWRAQVDGRASAIFQVNGAFRGTCIDTSGDHDITFEYLPEHWKVALVLSSLGALACGGLLVTTYSSRGSISGKTG